LNQLYNFIEEPDGRIKTELKPAKILLQPDDRNPEVDNQKGISKVVVPGLRIHSKLEVIL
jgi:hypothetical protein